MSTKHEASETLPESSSHNTEIITRSPTEDTEQKLDREEYNHDMKQQKDGWCGQTSLTYVAKAHGIPLTQKKAAKATGTTTRYGVDPKNLVKGAKSLGFSVTTIANKPSTETLRKIRNALLQKKSVIVDYLAGNKLSDGHYSVVKKVTDTAIHLWDPEHGKTRAVPKQDFIARWKDISGNGGVFSRWAAILS